MVHLGTPASSQVLQDLDTLVIIEPKDPWTAFHSVPSQGSAIRCRSCDDWQPLPHCCRISRRHWASQPCPVRATPEARAVDMAFNGTEDGRTGLGYHPAPFRGIGEAPKPELVVRSLSEWIPDNTQIAIDVGSGIYPYVKRLTLLSETSAHLSSTLALTVCAVPSAIACRTWIREVQWWRCPVSGSYKY